jgi:site-specific DNA-methyltransferase (adenine-specific)
MSYLATATSSASDEWSAPAALVAQLADEFGAFDLDPAATPDNAKAPRYFTRDDDGLAQPWHARRVFVNPPYGRGIRAWIGKAIAETARSTPVPQPANDRGKRTQDHGGTGQTRGW